MPVREREQQRHPETERSPVPQPVVAFFAGLRKIFGKPEECREIVHEPHATVAHSGTWTFRVEITPDDVDGGYIAECLDVPGAMSQGETEQEAFENLIEAVQGVIALRMGEHFRTIDFAMEPVVASSRVVNVTF